MNDDSDALDALVRRHETPERWISSIAGDIQQCISGIVATEGSDAMTPFVKALVALLPRIATTDECPEEVALAGAAGLFATALGRPLSPDDRALLGTGLRALAAVGENDANRHNLDLMKNSIDLFIGCIARVLGKQLEVDSRRRLTRVLVRVLQAAPLHCPDDKGAEWDEETG